MDECHRRFVGWTLSLGRNVAWSVCGWTDRQGTDTSSKYTSTGKIHGAVSVATVGG